MSGRSRRVRLAIAQAYVRGATDGLDAAIADARAAGAIFLERDARQARK